MAGVAGADHADHAFALDDLAVFTSALDGRSDFHFRILYLNPIDNRLNGALRNNIES